MKTVVGLGELLWDVYPDARYLGGATTNVALHAGQLGAKAVIVSSVGVEEAGDALIQQVQEFGGETHYIEKNFIYATGQVKVKLDVEGVPHFECSKDTAFDHLVWQDQLQTLANACDAVVVGTLAQRMTDSRLTIQKFLDEASKALKVFDVNFRDWHQETETIIRETLKKVDIVKMNEQELDQMRKAFSKKAFSDEKYLSWLIDEYELSMAILTLGAEGCILINQEDQIKVPGTPVQVIDTTGCGDAFVAAMIVRQLENASLQETGEFANRLAAFVATRKGAVPKIGKEDLNP